MAGTPDKGKFSTSIGQDVIDEAVRAVQKHAAEGAGAEPPAAGLTPEADPLPPEMPAPLADPLRKDLEEVKRQLELSETRGRELVERLKDTNEKMLRAAADLENYKRRSTKEREAVQKYGVERLLLDLLPIPDNLDRALEHARSPADFESLKTGLQMTRRLFEDTLAKHGVKSFSALGQPFDPRYHEAMQHVETSDMAPGLVAAEVLRGYTLNDRLARPALVVVSKAVEGAEPPAPAPEAPDAGGGSPEQS